MIELDNRTSLEVNEKFLNSVAHALTKKDIELIVTSNEEIREINREFRNIDKDTDVLSFPFVNMPMAPLGSIVISSDHVEEKSKEFGHSCDDEFALLFIHGLLHLLGFDHEVDNGEMREKEAALIKKFNLPQSLIVRTQG
ncbi:MAG: rRNA maturation RNase YbeY [Sulfurimonas sp.]|nr:rRNA maturation RNase YbeY [Sulfurimonas sp.]MBU1216226.1 rRNA maturation RNase YbeY [bacterium]MBU1434532.1 rRNA maturation RNase YbeY [bacterium]MBU1502110.1 rRNA maturation RNase YbeY [bacterium]MBU3939236.1 rRNA maturation RNase YbeY [bacterium]